MPLQAVYLVSAKNLDKFLEAIRHAQPPEKFALRFIEDLGFKSTNDRLFIPLLKAMKFLDDTGKPTARYHSFLDDTEWKRVLADGIRDAYSDLFRVNRNAHTLTREQLSGKIKSLSEGKISPAVLINMTKTFAELVKRADFSASGQPSTSPPVLSEEASEERVAPAVDEEPIGFADMKVGGGSSRWSGPGLVYRIEIVLPAVRDQAIYDAIFRSARVHLLK
jgi:hypothetical protein